MSERALRHSSGEITHGTYEVERGGHVVFYSKSRSGAVAEGKRIVSASGGFVRVSLFGEPVLTVYRDYSGVHTKAYKNE